MSHGWGGKTTSMKKTVLLFVSFMYQALCHPSSSAAKVFYVMPTGSFASECPSSPCYSLQYYANHSNFTSNSRFFFLEGEHHLDTVVSITNVTSLSLEGSSSSRVKIICTSLPSGFDVTEFKNFNLEGLALSNCLQSNNATFRSTAGSGLSVNDISVSSGILRDSYAGLVIINVTDSLNITSSQSSSVLVNYAHCVHSSLFIFSKNKIRDTHVEFGLSLEIHCSNVHVWLIDSVFIGNNVVVTVTLLTNVSIIVENSVFKESEVIGNICLDVDCSVTGLHCGHNIIALIGSNLTKSPVVFFLGADLPKTCAIAVKDSMLYSNSQVALQFQYNSRKSTSEASIQAMLNNVTFANYFVGCQLFSVTVLLVNCTFENSIASSAIQAESSKLIFHGYNVCKNNSALIGAGLVLTSSSHLFLRPHTHILFEDNYADYVGGAIYIDNQPQDPCPFHVTPESPSSYDTVEMNFINNSAGFAGFSLYGSIFNCDNLHNFFKASNTESVPSAIASDPNNVCFCENGAH